MIRNLASRMRALPAVARASIWALLATASFAVNSACVRVVAQELPAVEVVLCRVAVGLSFLLVYFRAAGFGKVRTGQIRHHVLRASLAFAGMLTWFWGLGRMPLGEAVALHFTLPLWAVLLAGFVLRERVSFERWAATCLGFGGVMVILRPGMADIDTASVVVLVSAAFYAGTVIYVKYLARTDSAVVITFYNSLIISLIAIVPAAIVWETPEWRLIPYIVVLGATGTFAPILFTRALKLADASIMVPFDFLRLPFTALAAFFAFGEVPTTPTWIGAAIIAVSIWYLAQRQARREHMAPES